MLIVTDVFVCYVLFSYPDFIAVAVGIVLAVVVALGVRCSTRLTTVFVVVNVFVLSFVTVCGLVYGHISNWTSVEIDGVRRGFMPYGWAGVVTGSAACFWTCSGFEIISSAVEECHNPQRHIPIAMLLTMLIVTTLYIGTAAGMTLLIPCQLLDTGAPLPSAFAYAGLTWGQYIVAIGPLCGFTTASISNTFGFVRLSLAMAEDGVLWSWFADVNEKTRVPVLPVILCGLVQSVIACFFDIRELILFSVSLLLLSYVFVCVAVIMLRYSDVTHQQTTDSKSSVDKDLCLSRSMHQISEDAGELSAVASDEHIASRTVSEISTDANKGNEGHSFDNTTFENGTDIEERVATTNVTEDGPTSASDHLLPDETHPVAFRSLLPRCGCLESYMICRGHICIKVAIALMLMSMLALAFVLTYDLVPLELGQWWSIVLVAVASCGVLFFMGLICIHRQTLQTAVLTVSFPVVLCYANCSCQASSMVLFVLYSSQTNSAGPNNQQPGLDYWARVEV